MACFSAYDRERDTCGEFEKIFVEYEHLYPVTNKIGAGSAVELRRMQSQSVVLDRGLNINFGKQLKASIVAPPVYFSKDVHNKHPQMTPSSLSLDFITFNTGTVRLTRNERIAVVPPMCDCSEQFKIKGVIPYQTVSLLKYTAYLNGFLDWVRGVTLILNKYCQVEESMQKKVMDISYEYIKENPLVIDMINNITVPDGSNLSKIETLYTIVKTHWMKPLFSSTGVAENGAVYPTNLACTLLALEDTSVSRARALQENVETMSEENRVEFNGKLKETVKEILKIPDYYTTLVKYWSPISLPEIGIVCAVFSTTGSIFHIEPGQKMTIRKYFN